MAEREESESSRGWSRNKSKQRRRERPVTPDGMRLQLAGLCARSEQNEYDLRMKMQRKGLSAEEIDGVIDFLKSDRYLDEHRFARAYANDKVRFSGWGINRIRQGLMMKRISRNVISEALDGIDRSEYLAALKRTGIAKARTVDIRTPSGRDKFYRHMLSRGFEIGLVSRLADAIIRKISNGNDVAGVD